MVTAFFLGTLGALKHKMFSRKYTIIFIPDVAGQFRRFSVPKTFVKGAAAVGMICCVVFGYFAYTVLQKSSDLGELNSLRAVSTSQKLEIQQFNQKLRQIETQIARLEQFDKKLRVITALESQVHVKNEFGSGG